MTNSSLGLDFRAKSHKLIPPRNCLDYLTIAIASLKNVINLNTYLNTEVKVSILCKVTYK